jgi:hypothetical protein
MSEFILLMVNTIDIFILCDPLKPLYAAVLRGLRAFTRSSYNSTNN